MAGIVLVLALGLGAALTSIEAADRTRSAYPDYLDRADVADLVVNPVLANERTQEIIESTPGVRRAVSDSLLTGAPVGDLDESSNFIQFRVSQDGRYTVQDRPVVRDGRMIRSGNEVFLSIPAAEEFDAEVGDVLDVGFFGINRRHPDGIEPGPMVREVDLRVVGIGTFADGVLPDELFPRQYALLTPEAAGDADCLQATFGPDDTRDPNQLLLAAVPRPCAMTYRYWSLDLEGGQGAAASVAADLGRRFQAESRNLPRSLREADIGYSIIPSFTSDDVRSVRQALSPAVTSLRVFGVVAGLVALIAALALVVRLVRRRADELTVWRELGLRTGSRAAAISALPGLAVVLGVIGAVGLAWLASPVGPVASARSLDPHPAHALGGPALLAALVAVVLLVAGAAYVCRRAARPWSATSPSVGRSPLTGPVFGSPMRGLGVRAALQGRDAVPAVIGVATAVAAVVATLLFAVAIGQVVQQPARYGWGFDYVYLGNYGYDGIPLDTVRSDLDRPEVEAWSGAVLSGNLTINGETVPSLAGREGFEQVVADLPVLDGRLPTGADELAVGTSTADDLGVEVGDEVTLASPFGEHTATISGLVVLPDIGPFQSDRTSLSTGVLLPGPTLEATYGDSEEATGLTPVELADAETAAVLVDLDDGVDAEDLLADLGGAVDAWDPTGFGVSYPDPVRSATIVDLAAVRGLPSVLAGLFAAAMAIAVLAGLAAGTRASGRELAVVRSLGATRRQRRTSVRVHALTTVLVGTLLGLPVGVVLSRWAFRALAHDMGVADDVDLPLPLVAAVAGGALLVALVAAEVLARRAVVRRPVPVAEGA
jgi:hypothetical protein